MKYNFLFLYFYLNKSFPTFPTPSNTVDVAVPPALKINLPQAENPVFADLRWFNLAAVM